VSTTAKWKTREVPVGGGVTVRSGALDREGHCFVALQTQQNVLRLRQKAVASQQLVLEEDPETAPEPSGALGAARKLCPTNRVLVARKPPPDCEGALKAPSASARFPASIP
jgi:hypothetical protein